MGDNALLLVRFRVDLLTDLANHLELGTRLPLKFILTMEASAVLPPLLRERSQIIAIDSCTNVRESINAAKACMGAVEPGVKKAMDDATLILSLQQQRGKIRDGIGWHLPRLDWEDCCLEAIHRELTKELSERRSSRTAPNSSTLCGERCRTMMTGTMRSFSDAELVREQTRLIFGNPKVVDEIFEKLESLGYSSAAIAALPHVDDINAFGVEASEKLYNQSSAAKAVDSIVKGRIDELWAWAVPSSAGCVSDSDPKAILKTVRAALCILPMIIALSEAESRVWSWGSFQPDLKRGTPLNIA
jgi:hypothetical protein